MRRPAATRLKTTGRAADTAQVSATTVPPDDAACWRGDWRALPPLDEVWAQAAMARTVRALPQLHPWRLGDAKGSTRLLQWTGAWPDDDRALALLAVTARDPGLQAGDEDRPHDLTLTGLGLGAGPTATDLARRAAGEAPRWAGVVLRLPGTWLPPIAWLPRALRDLDDPRTQWASESLDFATRYTVHTDELRTSAALLTPAVMALMLDAVPSGCAITLSGDAVHLWWPYRGTTVADVGRVARAARAATRLAAAVPRFVLAEHPDRSGVVEGELAQRSAAARDYRAGRRPGRSTDPVMQRIYDQARAALPPS